MLIPEFPLTNALLPEHRRGQFIATAQQLFVACDLGYMSNPELGLTRYRLRRDLCAAWHAAMHYGASARTRRPMIAPDVYGNSFPMLHTLPIKLRRLHAAYPTTPELGRPALTRLIDLLEEWQAIAAALAALEQGRVARRRMRQTRELTVL